MDVSIGARIKAARTAAGMTQMDVARRTDLSLQAVGDIERGIVRDPHISSLRQIARALGIPVTQMLEDSFREPVPLADAPREAGPHGRGAEPTASDSPEEEQAAEPLSPKLRRHVASMRRAELDRVLKHLTLRLETLRDQAKTHYEADATPKVLWPVFMDSLLLTRGAEALLAENREEAEELGGETAEERRLRGRLELRIEDADEVRGTIGDMWRELLDAENEAENEALRKEGRPKTGPADVDNVRNLFRREQAV